MVRQFVGVLRPEQWRGLEGRLEQLRIVVGRVGQAPVDSVQQVAGQDVGVGYAAGRDGDGLAEDRAVLSIGDEEHRSPAVGQDTVPRDRLQRDQTAVDVLVAGRERLQRPGLDGDVAAAVEQGRMLAENTWLGSYSMTRTVGTSSFGFLLASPDARRFRRLSQDDCW
ncbi:hypothetical protein GCM10029992_30110 [Glycomyces albus]